MAQPSLQQQNGVIWFNGAFVPWNEANIHIMTHAVHYGSAVFEGVRAYNGKIFKLQEHTERLFKSADILNMKPEFSMDAINRACEEILLRNDMPNAYIRPLVWRAGERTGVGGVGTTTETMIAVWNWKSSVSAETMEKGIVMKTAPWKRPPPECAPVHAKAAGLYMIATLSKQQAEKGGYQDCLLLDWRGNIAEATAANIFLIMNGELHTPVADCFLNGITRLTVIDLAKQAGIKVVERHIRPEELANAQEVFLTGTAYEIMPVGMIDDYTFTPGAVTRKLQDLYYKLAGRTA